MVTSVGGAAWSVWWSTARAAIVSAQRSLVDPIPAVLASPLGRRGADKGEISQRESGRRLISILAPEQLFQGGCDAAASSGQTGTLAAAKGAVFFGQRAAVPCLSPRAAMSSACRSRPWTRSPVCRIRSRDCRRRLNFSKALSICVATFLPVVDQLPPLRHARRRASGGPASDRGALGKASRRA